MVPHIAQGIKDSAGANHKVDDSGDCSHRAGLCLWNATASGLALLLLRRFCRWLLLVRSHCSPTAVVAMEVRFLASVMAEIAHFVVRCRRGHTVVAARKKERSFVGVGVKG